MRQSVVSSFEPQGKDGGFITKAGSQPAPQCWAAEGEGGIPGRMLKGRGSSSFGDTHCVDSLVMSWYLSA